MWITAVQTPLRPFIAMDSPDILTTIDLTTDRGIIAIAMVIQALQAIPMMTEVVINIRMRRVGAMQTRPIPCNLSMTVLQTAKLH